MTRTTDHAVAKIIETDVGDDLLPFIEAASIIVDRIAGLSLPPSNLELELVERWLAAHYYGVYKQRAASEGAGSVNESKQYWLGYGFQTTMHGTQAMTLDSTGTLSAINATIKGDKASKSTGAGRVYFVGSSL